MEEAVAAGGREAPPPDIGMAAVVAEGEEMDLGRVEAPRREEAVIVVAVVTGVEVTNNKRRGEERRDGELICIPIVI